MITKNNVIFRQKTAIQTICPSIFEWNMHTPSEFEVTVVETVKTTLLDSRSSSVAAMAAKFFGHVG